MSSCYQMSLSKYILKILYMYVSFKVGLKKYCTNGCGHSLPFEYVCFGLSMVPKLLCVACMPDSYKYVELAIFESKRQTKGRIICN